MTQLQPLSPSSSDPNNRPWELASGTVEGASSPVVPTTPTNITPANPILAVEQLTFAYPGCSPILNNISFTIDSGETVGLIGPNGAGKTSLFMALCGVFPAKTGTISLFGQPIMPGEFQPTLGMVFQNPDDQLFSASVEADVAFGPENMGLSPEEVAMRTEAALSLTGMLEHQHRPPHHLSGGEKRMVAIASVLSMMPDLIIYDEPSANLDLRARRRLIQFLKNSQETMLISSHDLEFLLEVCDRVLLLDQGQIIADDCPVTVMGNESLMLAHGLEKPHSLMPHGHGVA